MNPIRQTTYSLLARLFLAPPDVELLRQLATLPPFDSTLEGVSIHADTVETYQVYYQELFGFNFFPYESLFLEQELMVNTAVAGRVAGLMEQSGFDATPYSVGAADHIGVQLEFMAFLIAQEMDGISHYHDHGGEVEAARHYQAIVIHQHLARWVPVAMLTMQTVARAPHFKVLAGVTLELVLSEVSDFSAADTILEVENHSAPSLPTEDETEEQGLSSLIRPLVTPVECGLFLTRSEIRTMARQLKLPTLMGDRFGMLKQLFESAGQFEQIEQLLTALAFRWNSAENEINSLMNAAPAWAPYGECWIARLRKGKALLETLRTTWQQHNDGL